MRMLLNISLTLVLLYHHQLLLLPSLPTSGTSGIYGPDSGSSIVSGHRLEWKVDQYDSEAVF